jgi:2-amino-4-hydroxy-6-hydroxymethyldihydropteridine diphosphokinase
MVTCYLSLGANLGNRPGAIKNAVTEISRIPRTRVLKLSHLIKTKPIGGPKHQPDFLNAALKIKTALAPLELLDNLKTIEKKLGRKKTVRWGPRAIDLDILFYSNRVVNNKRLKIPHPRVFKRMFVLKPLIEVI